MVDRPNIMKPPQQVTVQDFLLRPVPTFEPIRHEIGMVSPLIPHGPGTANNVALLYDRLASIYNPVQKLFSRNRNAKSG